MAKKIGSAGSVSSIQLRVLLLDWFWQFFKVLLSIFMCNLCVCFLDSIVFMGMT